MLRPLVVVAAIYLILGECSRWAPVDVIGDESSAHASVHLDGWRRGSLSEAELIEETAVQDGLHEWWGDEQPGDTLWRASDRWFRARTHARARLHTITIKCNDGTVLESAIDVKVYNTVKVSCAEKRIKIWTEAD